jgi:small subunit ribosomal protein S27Ae
MKHQPVKMSKFFKIDGKNVKRTKNYCPRCGDGYILSEHKDRTYCGNCHYTEIKKVKVST